jgi:predicted O-methyltransferase YrrM
LGHSAKTVVWGSLAACQRRQQGATLSWLANRIREGKEHPEDFEEAVEAVDNRFAASSLVLAACTLSARKGAGDIIEAGSGLTTVMMAAAIPGRRVYAMEHDPVYSFLTQRWARSAGVNNIALIEGMQDCWYDLTDCDLPERFALGLCDGPPRHYGTRMRFFEKFGQRCDRIIVDDVDNAEYLRKILDWCSANNRAIEHQQGRLAVIR